MDAVTVVSLRPVAVISIVPLLLIPVFPFSGAVTVSLLSLILASQPLGNSKEV